jgi:hypothetical protein
MDLAASLTLALVALAQGYPKERRYGFPACLSGTATAILISKSPTGYSYEAMGTTRSNRPVGMMDGGSTRRVGMKVSLGGCSSQNTLCEAADHEDGKQLAYLVLGPDGRITREMRPGTGKYAGLQMSGVSTALGTFPMIELGTFQTCNQQTDI